MLQQAAVCYYDAYRELINDKKMPIIYGVMYPEIESAGLLNNNLRIFFILEDKVDLPKQLIELCTLREYLKSIQNCQISIDIYTNLKKSERLEEMNIKTVEKDEISDYEKYLIDIVNEYSIDTVVAKDKRILELFKNKELVFSITDYEGSKKNAEIFVRGHEIPWSFMQPIWNNPWEAFYNMGDEFAKRTFSEYQDRFLKLNLDSESLEIIRSLLLNRISQICYTRDKLLFIIQQKKFAKRQRWERQGFTFEATYYLSYYYFALWGGIDQLSRVISKILDIDNPKDEIGKIGISISDERFIKKINEKFSALGNLYSKKEFREWIKQLKRNRHFVAHEGCAMLSPIVQEPEGGISDEEIEVELAKDESLIFLGSMFGEDFIEPFKALYRENIRLSKYKVMAEEVMIIKDKKQNKQFIFKPLLNVEWDFNNFEMTIIQTLELLYKHLSIKKNKST